MCFCLAEDVYTVPEPLSTVRPLSSSASRITDITSRATDKEGSGYGVYTENVSYNTRPLSLDYSNANYVYALPRCPSDTNIHSSKNVGNVYDDVDFPNSSDYVDSTGYVDVVPPKSSAKNQSDYDDVVYPSNSQSGYANMLLPLNAVLRPGSSNENVHSKKTVIETSVNVQKRTLPRSKSFTSSSPCLASQEWPGEEGVVGSEPVEKTSDDIYTPVCYDTVDYCKQCCIPYAITPINLTFFLSAVPIYEEYQK